MKFALVSDLPLFFLSESLNAAFLIIYFFREVFSKS